jgi:hypothetical protein
MNWKNKSLDNDFNWRNRKPVIVPILLEYYAKRQRALNSMKPKKEKK